MKAQNESSREAELNAIQHAYAYSRVSSTKQLGGTGIKRQSDPVADICKEKQWTLAKETFSDFGVSAFRGKKRLKGDLSTFIQLAKEKKLKANPCLILEEWSRFSRQDIDESEGAIIDLLKAGVAIHIHFANKTFTKQSTRELGDRIEIMVACKAAYEYSANLSKRVAKAYETKKTAFLEGKSTAYRFKGPGWLRWNKQTQTYDPIPEKVESIERVFQLCLDGLGVNSIARTLTKEKATLIGSYNGTKIKSKNWANSTINRILSSGEVIGLNPNFEPPRPMFPVIIPEKTYYKAKEIMGHRQTHKYYGRNNQAENLFQGIAKCSVCGRSLVLHKQKRNAHKRNPNYGKRGGYGARGGNQEHLYLWCSGYVSRSCSSKQVIYEAIEESFFAIMTEEKFRNAILSKVHGKKDDVSKMDVLQGKLAETRKRLAKYASDYEQDPSNTLASLMAKTERQEKDILTDIENQKAVEIGTTPAGEAYKTFGDLLEPKDNSATDWDTPEVRNKIKECIRALVERIEVNIKSKSYDVYLKYGKPVHVQLYRNGFKVDGHFFYFHRNLGGYSIPLAPIDTK